MKKHVRNASDPREVRHHVARRGQMVRARLEQPAPRARLVRVYTVAQLSAMQPGEF